MAKMLSWHLRSDRRNTCRYNCCHVRNSWNRNTKGAERAREKRAWRKKES